MRKELCILRNRTENLVEKVKNNGVFKNMSLEKKKKKKQAIIIPYQILLPAFLFSSIQRMQDFTVPYYTVPCLSFRTLLALEIPEVSAMGIASHPHQTS